MNSQVKKIIKSTPLRLLAVFCIYLGIASTSRFFQSGNILEIVIPLIIGLLLLRHKPCSQKFLLLIPIFLAFSIVLVHDMIVGEKVLDEVCTPKVIEYYQVRSGNELPNEPVGKYPGKTTPAYYQVINNLGLPFRLQDKFPRWWYQTYECKDNVLNGKGPIFTHYNDDFSGMKK